MVLDRDGAKIGTIKEIFLVEETGRPEWALVKIGRLKGHSTLVPLMRARPSQKGVEVDVAKDMVAGAPAVGADEDPSEQQVNALYRHYGLDPDAHTTTNGASEANVVAPVAAANGAGSDLRDAPIGDVVKQVSGEAQTLIGQELRLAKAEIGEKAKDVGIGAGLFGGAGYVAYLASIALMLTVIFALAEVMAEWTAALIVTVLLAAVAGVLAIKAKQRIKQAGPPIPEQTVQSVKQTIQTVKEEATWGLGQTR